MSETPSTDAEIQRLKAILDAACTEKWEAPVTAIGVDFCRQWEAVARKLAVLARYAEHGGECEWYADNCTCGKAEALAAFDALSAGATAGGNNPHTS